MSDVMEQNPDYTKYTPEQYFSLVKNKKNQTNDAQLQDAYDSCLSLLEKYVAIGQTAAAKKLIFQMECIEKERILVKSGIDTFVYRDDIEEYIDNIADDAVKIIELHRYEREIPDEIADVMVKTKNLFDEFYVVFTDYTGKMERKVAEERRAKDPILFGAFLNTSHRVVMDRFYYLGDWEDEYCSLTLDKMVSQIKKNSNRNISHDISTPLTLEDLKQQLSKLEKSTKTESFLVSESLIVAEDSTPNKTGLFKNIKTMFSRKKK